MPTVAPFNIVSNYRKGSGVDLRVDTSQSSNNMQSYNGNSNMAASPVPYIKNEPLDSDFPRRFSHHGFSDAYSMSGGGAYHHQSPDLTQNYDSIDPSTLTMSPTSNDQGTIARNIPLPGTGGFSYPQYNTTQNMGFLGISTDELLDLEIEKPDDMNGFPHSVTGNMANYDMHIMANTNNIPMGAGTLDSGYSHTPDHALAESPFARPYQGHQLRHAPSLNSANMDSHSSYASPIGRGPMDMNGHHRSPLSRSPNAPNPRTPALAGLSINGTDSSSLPPQPIQNHHMGIHRHHKSLPGGGQWDNTPSSYLGSPLSSPGVGNSDQHQISELMKAKHASLPTKVENPGPGPTYQTHQTQEAKRRRRRESHNLVERRRRDHINERIQELSHLVPQHRLEDEKVRKHLQNNSPLSPTIGATGVSPPRATSMLAGGVGRRASGVSGVGLPGDEKDKGPNKGDILNGAVSWTRDLMWCLHEKYKQEDELREWAAQHGLQFPIETTEDEKRMKSELMASVERNFQASRSFAYSRTPGSGLRVPNFTDIAGGAITVDSPGVTSPSLSPVHVNMSGIRSSSSTGSAVTSLSRVQSQGPPGQQPQFWPGNEDAFKEEEFGSMDIS